MKNGEKDEENIEDRNKIRKENVELKEKIKKK